jgi:excisionase family DNA binding protein
MMTAVTITQITYQELELLIDSSIRKIMNKHMVHFNNEPSVHTVRLRANNFTPEEIDTINKLSSSPKVLSHYSGIMKIEEAAEFLSVSKQTIYGLTSRNEIPFHKKGKKLYFIEQELIDWIKKK